MGRKKIEIRPLVDERNRNVTFLKRKAGLMKKAWELSVLCGADVSILIFNANGKPYEFSSKELDGELERYQEYEGMIERRRAEEFAAAAAAGEDSDDDDDDGDRRASTSKAGAAVGANGAPKPGKSLKGKETFKQRSSRSRDSDRRERERERDEARRRRRRERERKVSGERMGFIDGLLDGSQSGSDDEGGRHRIDRKPNPSDLAGLQYAMGMHAQNGGPHASGSSHSLPFSQNNGGLSANGWNHHQFGRPSPGAITAESHTRTDLSNGLGAPHQSQGYPFPGMSGQSSGPMPMPSHQPPMSSLSGTRSYDAPSYGYAPQSGGGGGGSQSGQMFPPQSVDAMQQLNWDPSLLTRYAEFQLQQNHQRQQRILLEKQRHQLAQLGVPLEDKTLLDDIFGMGGRGGGGGGGGGGDDGSGGGRESSAYANGLSSSSTSTPPFGAETPYAQPGQHAQNDEFVWPTFRSSSLPHNLHDHAAHAPPPPQIRDHRNGPTEEDAMWATLNGFGQHPADNGEGDMQFHSPASPAMAYGGPKRRHTEDFAALSAADKRIRV